MAVPVIIDVMAQLEHELAALYDDCAQLFSEDSALYRRLHGDELAHGRILRGIVPLLEKGVELEPDRFNPQAVRLALQAVREHRERVRKGSVSGEEALAAALGYENGLIERRFFDVVRQVGAGAATAAATLEAATQEHRALLQARLQEVRRTKAGST